MYKYPLLAERRNPSGAFFSRTSLEPADVAPSTPFGSTPSHPAPVHASGGHFLHLAQKCANRPPEPIQPMPKREFPDSPPQRCQGGPQNPPETPQTMHEQCPNHAGFMHNSRTFFAAPGANAGRWLRNQNRNQARAITIARSTRPDPAEAGQFSDSIRVPRSDRLQLGRATRIASLQAVRPCRGLRDRGTLVPQFESMNCPDPGEQLGLSTNPFQCPLSDPQRTFDSLV